MKKVYWYLPYDMRRSLFRVKNPTQYQLFNNLRTALPKESNLRSFKPFIENKCIFIHIPKAAGISVGKSIFGRQTGNHTTIKEYQIIFNQNEFNSYFKFTFVRNPWDRLLSAFIYMKNGGRNKWDKQWAEKYLSRYKSFNEFVIDWADKKNINVGLHFKPQYEFITTPNAIKPEVDFIGFFENIDNDYETIRKKLGIGEKLKCENKTIRKEKDYRAYYNDKTIEIVSNIYSKDIDLFGYDFENDSLDKQLKSRQ